MIMKVMYHWAAENNMGMQSNDIWRFDDAVTPSILGKRKNILGPGSPITRCVNNNQPHLISHML